MARTTSPGQAPRRFLAVIQGWDGLIRQWERDFAAAVAVER